MADSVFRAFVGALALSLGATAALADGARITFDRSERHQTMTAWEATVDLFWPDKLTPLRDEMFDRLLDDVGITRLRVGIFSSTENTDQSFERMRAGTLSGQDYRDSRYVTVNDDDDPFHINWAGFDFANLDWRIDTTVLPLMAAAKARGKTLEFNLNYVAFTDQNKGGTYIHTDPEEYAEFMLATFLHMQEKYGFVPDDIEALLEPENSPNWTPELLGRAIAAATKRLNAAGFHPRFIAPSVTDARNAVPWIEGIASVPGALEAVREMSYHRYLGGRNPVIKDIGDTAARLGINTSMLELWFDKATYEVLYSDLTLGNVSAWQGNTVSTHFEIDPAHQNGAMLIPKENVRYFRQYTAYVRPGDTRIGAGSTNPRLAAPVAFEAPDGGITIVLKSERGGQAELSGLPAGTYYISYAVEAGSGRYEEPFAVVEGTPLIVDLPGKGVVTVSPRAE
jgi:hypothetical protein